MNFQQRSERCLGRSFLPSTILIFPQTVYCWGSQCCLKCVRLGWGAVSASLGLSPNVSPISLCLSPWLGCCVRLAGLVSQFVSQFVSHLALSFTLAGVWACLPICLAVCLPSGFVFHLGWGAVSASLGLSPNLSPIWLCLSAWLGCCVRLAGLVSQFVPQFVSHLALSFTLAGVLCPPRWACLPICLPVFSPHLFPICLCLSPWLGCCVRLAGLVSGLVFQFVSQFVSHLALSFTLAGALCPPRWACLLICLPICLPPGSLAGALCPPRWACLLLPQTVYGSASLGLSPVLSPTLSPIWSGMLCPPRWSCLSLVCCLVSGLVCHLGWDAVSASLGCLRSCLPACLPSGLGCSVRLPGLAFLLSLALSPSFCLCFVSQLVFHLGCCVCPPWACLFLVSGLVSQLVSHLVWDAVSASLVLSFSCLRSCRRPCLPSWLGCCVRLAGLSPVLSPSLSPIWSGMLCPPRWSCLSLVCGLVSGLVCRHLGWDAVSASLGCLRSCLPACLPSGLGCSVRLPGLVFLLSLVLSPSLRLCFVS